MINAENVLKFIKGEITWAEVEGITAEQATRYMQMGVDFMNAGDFEKAQRTFECMVTLNPHDADAHALLGTALQAREHPELAVKAFSAALAINPKHVTALAGRGELRRKLGDSQGLHDLQRAAEIDPMGRTQAGQRAAQLVRALTFRPSTASRSRSAAVR